MSSRNAPPHNQVALRDDTNSGCEGDYLFSSSLLVSSRNAPPHNQGVALRDDTNSGCEGDYLFRSFGSFIFAVSRLTNQIIRLRIKPTLIS